MRIEQLVDEPNERRRQRDFGRRFEPGPAERQRLVDIAALDEGEAHNGLGERSQWDLRPRYAQAHAAVPALTPHDVMPADVLEPVEPHRRGQRVTAEALGLADRGDRRRDPRVPSSVSR